MSRRPHETLKRSTFGAICAGLLVAAALSVALLASAGAAKRRCGNSSAAPAHLTKHQMRTSILCLMNRVRHHHHLHKLSWNKDLRHAATGHSTSMVHHDYFSHGAVDGRVSRSGYLAHTRGFTVGENIAAGVGRKGSPWAIFQDWMHSPPHRANILDPTYRDAGVGVARGFPFGSGRGGSATYTVDFGRRRG